MSDEIVILAGTDASIRFTHTILGPDHHLPFIVLARARQWSHLRTFTVAFLCVIGRVLGSVALGFVRIAVGIAVFKLEAVEAFRGEVAAWLLIAFGFAYFVWGLRKALRQRGYEHVHPHENGEPHLHNHNHAGVSPTTGPRRFLGELLRLMAIL